MVPVPAGPRRMTERQRILAETAAARDDARTLLRALIEARAAAEGPRDDARPDLFKRVTGRSSYDAAIESTRRTIDHLGRVLAELERDPPVAELPAPPIPSPKA